jgi:hypothetical protein
MTRDRQKAARTGSTESIVFTTFLLVVVRGLLAATAGMQTAPALVPRLVGVPLAALLACLLIRELRVRSRQPASGPETPDSPAGDELRAILWLLALPAIATLLGFVVGPALYVFAWARFRGGERVSAALAASAVAALAILLLFTGLLGARLPSGLLGELLP